VTILVRIGLSLILLLAAALAGLSSWSRIAVTGAAGVAPIPLHLARKDSIDSQARCTVQEPCDVEKIRALTEKTIGVAPTSAAPLIALAVSQFSAGDLPAAAESARKALKRDPRTPLAQAVLAADAVAKNDPNTAIARLYRVAVMSSSARTAAFQDMALLARSPAGFASVSALISEKADYSDMMVSAMNAAQIQPQLLIGLAAPYPHTLRQIIETSITKQSAGAAYRLWLQTLPEEARPKVMAWPYDQKFQRLPGVAPFNWELTPGRAEYETGGGLIVVYLGEGHIRLAWQSLLLPSAPTTLRAKISGEASGGGARLMLMVYCQSSNTSLGTVSIDQLDSSPMDVTLQLSAPPDAKCPVQQLELRGVPGQFPRRLRAKVHEVRIEPVGGAGPPAAAAQDIPVKGAAQGTPQARAPAPKQSATPTAAGPNSPGPVAGPAPAPASPAVDPPTPPSPQQGTRKASAS
jgi:hypothetical protein